MLDNAEVRQTYRDNYQLAIEEGHKEEASRIAWEWTWAAVERQFAQIKGNYMAWQQDAINKAHFG